MSFVGATAGSGALTDAPVSSQPSFKLVAAGALAKARDRIAQASRNLVNDIADDCASKNISDIEEQERRLWAKIFSSAYDQAEPIETAAAAKLAKAAQSFVAAWQAHKQNPQVQQEAFRRTEERIKREGYPWDVQFGYLWYDWPGDFGGAHDKYRSKIYEYEKLKYAVETFKPTLSFE
jgi:hypothetical protein